MLLKSDILIGENKFDSALNGSSVVSLLLHKSTRRRRINARWITFIPVSTSYKMAATTQRNRETASAVVVDEF